MKLIIVGKGIGWWFAPKEGEVWGINDIVIKHPCTRVFDMHDLDGLSAAGSPFKDHLPKQLLIQAVNNLDIPLVSIKKYDNVKNSEVYPLEEIEQRFDTSYFANGICYMVAFALYKGYKEIDFYGVNMNAKDEIYRKERPCVEWWLGIAKGMGVKINIKGRCSELLQTYDGKKYGYNTCQFTNCIVADVEEHLK